MRETDVIAMNDKHLTPWILVALNANVWYRSFISDDMAQSVSVAEVQYLLTNGLWVWGHYIIDSDGNMEWHSDRLGYQSATIAMFECDQSLIKTGYELLTQDRYDKLMLLL